MALSPPNATNAGLWTRHAAPRAKTASTVIQPIVMACTQMTRRTTSRGFASAVEDIAPLSTLSIHLLVDWAALRLGQQ